MGECALIRNSYEKLLDFGGRFGLYCLQLRNKQEEISMTLTDQQKLLVLFVLEKVSQDVPESIYSCFRDEKGKLEETDFTEFLERVDFLSKEIDKSLP